MKKFAIFFEDIQSPMENEGSLLFFDTIKELEEHLKYGFFAFDAWEKGDIDEDDEENEEEFDEEAERTKIEGQIEQFCSKLTEDQIIPELNIDIGSDFQGDANWNIHFIGKTDLFANSNEDFPEFIRAEFRGFALGEPVGRGPILPEEDLEGFFDFVEGCRAY